MQCQHLATTSHLVPNLTKLVKHCENAAHSQETDKKSELSHWIIWEQLVKGYWDYWCWILRQIYKTQDEVSNFVHQVL